MDAPTAPTDRRLQLEPSDRFIALVEVLGLIGLGRTAWTDLVREGRAPKPIKIGQRSLWIESEVRQWMAERVAESRPHLAVGNAAGVAP